LLDKSFLDREGYLNGTGMHEKASNWDDLPHEIIADSQPAGISPKLLVGIVAKHGGAVHEAEKFTIKDTPYLAGAVRLSDMNNREVGRMILFENIAEQSTAIRHLMFKLGSTSLLAAIAGLLGAFVYLQRVDRILEDYNRQVLDVVRQREADQIRHVKELLPFRKAFEGAPDAMGIIDLDRRMLFVNPAFEKLTGYTQETINERGGTETLYYDPQSGSRAFLKVSQGRSFNGELKIIDQAGDSIDVYLRASPIMKDDGEMIGILGIFSDLRERKSAEQELLRQAKALVETNRALMEARNAGYAACNRELS
jgi:PAS domain S-box-containing protein